MRGRCRIESRVVTGYDEFLKLRAPWEELHRSVNGSLFQLHDWLTAWWKAYGVSRSLSVHTFWNDALLVGVVPCFKEAKPMGPVSMRRMSMLGEEEAYGEYFPMAESGSVEEIAQSAASLCAHGLRRGEIDVVDLHGFPPDSPFMRRFLDWLSVGAFVRYIPENKPHFVIEGPTSGETYVRSMSNARRRSLRRQQRQIVDAGAEFELVAEWDGGPAFDDFVRLHTLRWSNVGQPGRFGSARFTEFLRTVTERLMSSGMARMYFIRLRGERICAVLDFQVGSRCYSYIVGRNPANELMRYSIGEVLAMRATMDAFDAGALSCDLMGGDYQHKHVTGVTKRWYARATAVAVGVKGMKGYLYWGGLAMRDAMARAKRLVAHPGGRSRREAEKA